MLGHKAEVVNWLGERWSHEYWIRQVVNKQDKGLFRKSNLKVVLLRVEIINTNYFNLYPELDFLTLFSQYVLLSGWIYHEISHGHMYFLGIHMSLSVAWSEQPFIMDTSLKWIDREGLGESGRGTRQGPEVDFQKSVIKNWIGPTRGFKDI